MSRGPSPDLLRGEDDEGGWTEHQAPHRQAGKDEGHAIRYPVHFYRLCEQKDQVEVLELNLQSGL